MAIWISSHRISFLVALAQFWISVACSVLSLILHSIYFIPKFSQTGNSHKTIEQQYGAWWLLEVLLGELFIPHEAYVSIRHNFECMYGEKSQFSTAYFSFTRIRLTIYEWHQPLMSINVWKKSQSFEWWWWLFKARRLLQHLQHLYCISICKIKAFFGHTPNQVEEMEIITNFEYLWKVLKIWRMWGGKKSKIKTLQKLDALKLGRESLFTNLHLEHFNSYIFLYYNPKIFLKPQGSPDFDQFVAD